MLKDKDGEFLEVPPKTGEERELVSEESEGDGEAAGGERGNRDGSGG